MSDRAKSSQPSEDREVKIAPERRVIEAPPLDPGEQDKTSMAYISDSEESNSADNEMSVKYAEDKCEERKASESEIERPTTGI